MQCVPSPTRGLTQPERVEISSRRLVEAAAELIVEKGWEATTAAEIGRRAGYSRAMVHARYGSKDAILDAFFLHDYVKQLSPDADPDATGLQEAVGHFDRVRRLFSEDQAFLRAMFVATFEGVKSTSPLRERVQRWLQRGVDKVEAGLRRGVDDGSVRDDVDINRATSDLSAAIFGAAYLWTLLGDGYDLDRELAYVRDRFIREYGSTR
ncbi:TetR/AcrR family transcriptional regulator [Mycolicibacterium tusciae]|jgi:AcrR family transcriptional regulator|uniref:TetR family transcriptional regulator n=1 Tax=Mycolicibacterium tusciae TaxID=75922 RepID=A0A1X0JQW9_9MYCO|nr:TetR/AcrR family transcriptional regulator [Mycolicibacterium tusciae]ORB65152.1 TetR family transcriptional regulator [Mycolicibacterium tusciae]